MTLIVAVTGPESIWLLADRRLSYAARAAKDDGRKIMFLETADGVAILGYAGLGATGSGTEPADWMSAVLRGRKLPLEQSLGVLAKAIQEQFPRHMNRMPGYRGAEHHVIVPAFVNGEARFYTIDLVVAGGRNGNQFRYTCHVANQPPTVAPRTPRICISGSGVRHLIKDESWERILLHIVTANDRGRISPRAVANHLASLNHNAHLGVADGSVGPRCIVAWRFRKGGLHKGGGGHQFFTGPDQDSSSPSLPNIANGMDLNGIAGVMFPHVMKMMSAKRAGEPAGKLNSAEVKAALARQPHEPDENLR